MTGILHIVVARKPIEGTIAENCLKHGTGTLNVDGCRIAGAPGTGHWTHKREIGDGNIYHGGGREEIDNGNENPATNGRFPANLILDTSTEVQKNFPNSTSSGGSNPVRRNKNGWKDGYFIEGLSTKGSNTGGLGDSGSASRFFFNFTEQESTE